MLFLFLMRLVCFSRLVVFFSIVVLLYSIMWLFFGEKVGMLRFVNSLFVVIRLVIWFLLLNVLCVMVG